jgi:hypothetical protein
MFLEIIWNECIVQIGRSFTANSSKAVDPPRIQFYAFPI